MQRSREKIATLLVAAAFAIVCWIAPAKADGLPKSSLPPLGEVAAKSTTWTGFYVGAHGGWLQGGWDGNLLYDPGTGPYQQSPTPLWGDTNARSLDGDAWTAGVSLGFNQQSGKIVWGLETDISWANLEESGSFRTYKPDGAAGDVVWNIKSQLDLFGTVRGRLGLVNGPVLIYATGGLAVGRTTSDLVVDQDNAVTARGSASETHVGWTAGGGLEWAIVGNITLKVEYLYVDLGDAPYRLVGTNYIPDPDKPHTTDSFPSDLDFHVIRGGLNFKF